MIDQATIDRIINTARIDEVVGDFVQLKRRGANFVGLCPFHEDRTPSFYVSPAKGVCKCFSCGEGGNVVHFIMAHEQLTWIEAIKWLARRYHIEYQEQELTPAQQQAKSRREHLFAINEWANDYFRRQLNEHIDGKTVAQAYLKSRGIRPDIVQKFQIGYCTNDGDAMGKAALGEGFKKETLIDTGLCYDTENRGLRDRFWGRVIFPVFTISGKVVAFGGRVLSTTNKKLAKYVNSPESEIYHKSNELYGMYQAKGAIVKKDQCFLVEGYTDVISLHQSGIENVVASSGTALTSGQIRLIHRFTKNITVLYDGDLAGIKASLRGIDMLLEQGMHVKVMLLPDGEDPDSFARKHTAQEFQQYIAQHEVDFIRFKTDLLIQDAKNDPIKRGELISNIVKSISVIPDEILRNVYIRECSEMMQIRESVIQSEVEKIIKEGLNRSASTHVSSNNTSAHTLDSNQGSNLDTTMVEEGKEENNDGAQSIDKGNAPIEISKERKEIEKRIIWDLVRYGECILGEVEHENEDGSITRTTEYVADYIAQELERDAITITYPPYKKLFNVAIEGFHKCGQEDEWTMQKFLVNQQDMTVSKLAAEMISSKYRLDKDRILKYKSDKARLHMLIPDTIFRMKHYILSTSIHEVDQAILNASLAGDKEKENALCLQRIELMKLQQAFAKELGDRTILPK